MQLASVQRAQARAAKRPLRRSSLLQDDCPGRTIHCKVDIREYTYTLYLYVLFYALEKLVVGLRIDKCYHYHYNTLLKLLSASTSSSIICNSTQVLLDFLTFVT